MTRSVLTLYLLNQRSYYIYMIYISVVVVGLWVLFFVQYSGTSEGIVWSENINQIEVDKPNPVENIVATSTASIIALSTGSIITVSTTLFPKLSVMVLLKYWTESLTFTQDNSSSVSGGVLPFGGYLTQVFFSQE